MTSKKQSKKVKVKAWAIICKGEIVEDYDRAFISQPLIFLTARDAKAALAEPGETVCRVTITIE